MAYLCGPYLMMMMMMMMMIKSLPSKLTYSVSLGIADVIMALKMSLSEEGN